MAINPTYPAIAHRAGNSFAIGHSFTLYVLAGPKDRCIWYVNSNTVLSPIAVPSLIVLTPFSQTRNTCYDVLKLVIFLFLI